MKIKVTPTKLFYVFGSPVTVRRSENIVLEGIEGRYVLISSPASRTSKIALANDSVTLKPYDMSYGIHELYAVDEKGVSIPIGTVGIVADTATVGEVCAMDAINKLALFVEDMRKNLVDVASRLSALEKERHEIDILK